MNSATVYDYSASINNFMKLYIVYVIHKDLPINSIIIIILTKK